MTTPEMLVVADLAQIERSSSHIDQVVVDLSKRHAEVRRVSNDLARSVEEYLTSKRAQTGEMESVAVADARRRMDHAVHEYRVSEAGNFLPVKDVE